MMRKKIDLAVLTTATLLLYSPIIIFFSAFSVAANSGTINFVGTIVDTACAVDVESSNQTVDLGQVRLAAFKNTVGTPAGKQTAFVISLAGCDTSVSKAASITFKGIPDSINNDVLAVGQGVGAARGIGIQITDKSGARIKLGEASATIPLMEGSTNLVFNAQYISTSSNPTAGNTIATARFIITYA